MPQMRQSEISSPKNVLKKATCKDTERMVKKMASTSKKKKMEIKIGTSGYSFEDWKGVFYPDNIKKGNMLDYYVEHFPTVEINSTYYRIPHPAVMANIEKKTGLRSVLA